jgi:subtilase family serine protease
MYTNSAVAAVVVEIEQNVIKQTRLEIFFPIISVSFIFELGCHLGTTQETLVNLGSILGFGER